MRKKKKVMQSAPQVPKWPRVYIGPVKRGGLVTHLQVFADGYPAQLEKVLAEHPELNDLFVQPAEMHKALMQVATKGTYLNSLFLKTKTLIGGLNV